MLVHPLLVIAMRPTPVHFPDEALEPACRAMGLPSPGSLPAALRAAIQAQLHAQLQPNPRARRLSRPHPVLCGQTSLGLDDRRIDIKRRAANDIDEE